MNKTTIKVESNEQKRLIGVLILCGLLFFLLCFTATHDYTLTKRYNAVVEEYNKCVRVTPNYAIMPDFEEKPTWNLNDWEMS